MNLEQLKSEMESDATKRCEAQAKTIADLIEQTKKQASDIRALQNRCYAHTRGTICPFCSMCDTCTSCKS